MVQPREYVVGLADDGEFVFLLDRRVLIKGTSLEIKTTVGKLKAEESPNPDLPRWHDSVRNAHFEEEVGKERNVLYPLNPEQLEQATDLFNSSAIEEYMSLKG